MYGGREQFLKVCLVEGLSLEQASDLFAFALRHKINVDSDPFMTLVLVLGLIREATNLNLKSSRKLAQDSADRTGKEFASIVEGVVRDGLRQVRTRWIVAVGIVAVACMAATFTLGATLALHQQARTTEFWSTIASSSDSAEWERFIKNNRSFPSERACSPQSKNYEIVGGQAYCSFLISWVPKSQQSNWFSAVLLGPSLKLGHFTPLALLAIGLVLGLSTHLARPAFQKRKTKG